MNNKISNNKKIKKAKAKNRKLKNKIKKLINNTRRSKIVRKNIIKRKVMGIASTKLMPKYYNVTKSDGTSCRVRGCDLVYSIPDNLIKDNDTQVIAIIPANPIYWTGTRMSALASGYQNYRPVSFQVFYVPEIAVTQPGNVIGGTLWNMVPDDSVIQQTLKTSNGGMITQCYAPSVSNIRMKSNLQFNLYRIGGDIDQESVPFIYLALAIACKDSNNNRVIPGWFYIKYDYILKNPIGNCIRYKNYNMIEYDPEMKIMDNSIGYLCENIESNGKKYYIGSKIDLELTQSNQIQPKYNGSDIELPLGSLIWLLGNESNTGDDSQGLSMVIYYSDRITTTLDSRNIIGLTGISYEHDGQIWSVLNNSQETFNYIYPSTMSDPKVVYVISNRLQNFGNFYDEIADGIIRFNAPKTTYSLALQTTTQSNQRTRERGPEIKESRREYQEGTITHSAAQTENNEDKDDIDSEGLIDYGIIGKDSKDPDFDSSKVKSIKK